MVFSSPAHAWLQVALRGDPAASRACFGLRGLILALFVVLFGGAAAPSHHLSADSPSRPRGIVVPACGRAPHAACVEAGLIPDWILPGTRNRGMWPAGAPLLRRRSTCPVRAPPWVASVPC